mgnify:CR=1 FL=1
MADVSGVTSIEGALMHIDHVVLAVRDLDAAGTRILERLGLGSVPGGRHPGWGTGNRIVPLGHEYVELLAVVDPVQAAASPVGTWISNASRSGDRLVAWCVSTDDIEGALAPFRDEIVLIRQENRGVLEPP